MDLSDVAIAIGGAGFGLCTSVGLLEVGRFRATMDQACDAVTRLDEMSWNCHSDLELMLGYDNHFKTVRLQLAMMEQRPALKILDRISNSCSLWARDEFKRIWLLHPGDPQIVSFNGNRWMMMQANCGFFHHQHTNAWIEELRNCGPDWEALLTSSLRNLGLLPPKSKNQKEV